MKETPAHTSPCKNFISHHTRTMEMQQMHHHLLANSPASVDFNSIFAGVSLRSLLLGEPVLVSPPPPPFPSLPVPPTTAISFAHPLQQYDNRVVHSPQQADDDRLLYKQSFFFQADAAPALEEKQRRHPARRSLLRCSSSSRSIPAPPRRQRQKVSEKLKALRSIVPCDQKADIATMLEQAYRYVRFLEAQVLALLTMQFSTLDDRQEGPALCFDDGTSEMERRMIETVGRLSRQEVVEAVVNSGTAQKVMYEEGLCLVSEEQVRVLGWATFQKQQQQKQLSGLIENDLGNNHNKSNNTCCYSYSYSNFN